MRTTFYILFAFFLVSCGTSPDPDTQSAELESVSLDTIELQAADQEQTGEFGDEYSEYATCYVVVADTGLNYHQLYSKLELISKELHIPVELSGRRYNKSKNLISLPEDDEDEIYAGEYFPRRNPSEELSLEYLNFYSEKAGEKTIALIAGIFEDEKDAKRALEKLKKSEPKAFSLKSEIYVGCMH